MHNSALKTYLAMGFIYVHAAAGMSLANAQVVKSDQSTKAGEQPRRVKMMVSPTGEPEPALRYQLLPTILEQKPGNAVTQYFMAAKFLSDELKDEDKERIGELDDIEKADWPEEEVQRLLGRFRQVLHQIDLGYVREECQWDIPIREEGFAAMLPPLGDFRMLSRLLAIEARQYIFQGNYEEAVESIKRSLTFASHIKGKLLISDLVSIAMAQLTLLQVEQFVQEDEAPNLYWALTMLPQPFVDMHESMRWEKEILYIQFPELQNLEDRIMSQEQAVVFGKELLSKFSEFGVDAKNAGALMAFATALRIYPAARDSLIEQGMDQAKVEAMPVVQVLLIYYNRQYQRYSHDIFKWTFLPYVQARGYLRGVEEEMGSLRQGDFEYEGNPLLMFVPALQRAFFVRDRLERQFAMLRCVEAIRMYAAGHEGALPASLSDIKEAPVPDDPLRGKAFGYRLDGDTAILESPAPEGEKAKEGLIYEITIRR